MGERHPILYELNRWQRYRTLLLLSATVCVMTALFLTFLKPNSTAASSQFLVFAAAFYALAASFWLRQRFSYVTFDGEALRLRLMALRQELPIEDVRRVKVSRVLAAYDRPDRRRWLPRPRDRWHEAEALVLRVTDARAQAFRRVLGRRGVFDDELIIPIAGASTVGAAMEAALRRRGSPPPATRPGRSRKRRRR